MQSIILNGRLNSSTHMLNPLFVVEDEEGRKVKISFALFGIVCLAIHNNKSAFNRTQICFTGKIDKKWQIQKKYRYKIVQIRKLDAKE